MIRKALDLGAIKLRLEEVISTVESGTASREMESLALKLGLTSADVFQIIAIHLNNNMAEINTQIMVNAQEK